MVDRDFTQSLVIEPERRELARLYSFAEQSDAIVVAYIGLGLVAGYLALFIKLPQEQVVGLGFLGGVLVGAGTERLVTRPLRRNLRRFLPRQG